MNNTNPKPNNMNNMNNMNEVNKIGETITKIYQKTSYLEKYGGSVFFTSIIFGGYAIYKARLNMLNLLRMTGQINDVVRELYHLQV